MGHFSWLWIIMLNFDQVGSRNLDKLPTNLVNWVLAMLLNLINFGSFWWIYINWVLANLGNFDSIWVILGQFSWIRIILLGFDQLGSCNYNKLCYILVTGFSLFWVTGFILTNFESLCSILGHFTPYTSIGFYLFCSTWLILDRFVGFTEIEFLQIWTTWVQFG